MPSYLIPLCHTNMSTPKYPPPETSYRLCIEFLDHIAGFDVWFDPEDNHVTEVPMCYAIVEGQHWGWVSLDRDGTNPSCHLLTPEVAGYIVAHFNLVVRAS